MINFNPPTNPVDVPATLQTLSGMVALLANPTAAAERVSQMQTATEDMAKQAEALKAERANFSIAQSEHQAVLDQQSADAAKKMAADQAAFDTACRTRSQELDGRSQELDARAAQLTEAQEEAKAATATAASLRADLEKRLSHIRAAMG